MLKQHRVGDLVWVHDYQLLLLPRMLREAEPQARVGFFLHIPFPPSGVFRLLPRGDELIHGLLGADYLAFHTHRSAEHRDYFTLMEPILRAAGGRPHWGKVHTRTAADLAPAYPRFEEFLAMRDRLDPQRVFANDYLRRVLGG